MGLGTYDDGNKVAPEGAIILNPFDINENATQKIPKSLQDQNFDRLILEISKDLDIPLTTT
jgi:hypothetical protein